MKPDKNQLGDADYNFTDVPPDELESCLYYEFARESEVIIQQVVNLRQQLSEEAKHQGVEQDKINLVGMKLTITKVMKSWDINNEVNVLLKLARVGEFPFVPWQNLSSSAKETLRQFPGKERRWLKKYPPLVMESVAENAAIGDTTLNSWTIKQHQQYKQVPAPEAEAFVSSTLPQNYFETVGPLTKFFVSGFFQINLNYSQPILRKAFNDLLKLKHPMAKENKTRPRGRQSPSDKLNALGAMRLRYHCSTLSEAQKLIAPLGKKARKMRYLYRENFNRACELAVHHFRTLLELPESHWPIHYTKNWRGGGR